jgi:peptidyl-dipeptidase A
MQFNELEFQEFAAKFEKTAAKFETEMALAYFKAAKNGSEENWKAFSEAEMKLNMHYADTNAYQTISKFKDAANIPNEDIKRHIELLYLDIKSKQIDEEILKQISNLQSKIEQKYTAFRAEVNGEKLDDNSIEEILKTSKDSERLQAVWEAHKLIGPQVQDDIKELVKLRNKAAKQLGYENYHTMSLILSEQDPDEILAIFDELDELTRNAYIEIKNEIDEKLSEQLKISKDELMPWHYQNRYFQESPSIFAINLDKFYKDEDVVKITQDYFANIGMPINVLIEASDLYPRENKNQHAFCINIDRDAKDVRVLCNVVPNFSWMETMMHEYGHAVYEQYYAEDMPWTMKEPAHIFTTEAIAMLFGRMASDPQWIQDNVKIDDKEKEDIKDISRKILSYQQLVFSRWAQVMYRFEKEMYANPDQDLDKLWWEIVEKYQMIKKPKNRNMPDWATKIHIATVPAYYHNYLLGEILASQLYFKVAENAQKIDDEFVVLSKNEQIGIFLKENVFAHGRKLHWSKMIENATGEPLTAKYYAKQFINKNGN